MLFGTIFAFIALAIYIIIFTGIIYLFVLAVKALRKYIKAEDARKDKTMIKKSLGEIIKDHRVKSNMTQEFVSEALGVSRQAVSKWESGKSDPSTSNLISLAKLFGIAPEELISAVSNTQIKSDKSNDA